MVETSSRYLIEDDEDHREHCEDEESENRWHRRRYHWRENWEGNFKGKSHYNRVDGFFLGGELPRVYNQRLFANIEVFGSGGYGFASHRWQYQAGAEFYLGRSYRSIFGAELHQLTDSQDEWIISEEENSFAAFFVNEDFRDYYRREGFSLYFSQKVGRPLQLTLGYHNDRHGALRNKTDWALFLNKKKFRENPVASDGRMRSYRGQIAFDTRDHEKHPRRGWLISLEGETSRPEWESHFDFDRVIIDLRRYQPLGYGRNIDVRLRAGSARGILPAQYRFDLGGISTLRGSRFKEFTGDRMVLANVEYRLNAGASRLRGIPVIEDLNLALFADTGYAWSTQDQSTIWSWDYFTMDKLKTNVGVAVTDPDGNVRLNLAKRIDSEKRDIVITFRLNRDF
jgi:outer membrane protein assembly factor BamA